MKQLRDIDLKRFLKNFKKPKSLELYLLLENIQYAKNVASIFRTAEAFSVKKIFLTGISRKPPFGKDLKKASRHKERSVYWEYVKDSGKVIRSLKKRDFEIVALEITDESIGVSQFEVPNKVLLVLGNEGYGVVKDTLKRVDKSVFIPMYGKGSSLNVNVACGITLHNLIINYAKQN
jgi:tRNA G18 (ribose-2'-O)-methylase SpoU